MCELGENLPNEANFDQSMSIVETQEAIQVTENSGVPAGLDTGVAQPEEASTPEPGKAPGSARPITISNRAGSDYSAAAGWLTICARFFWWDDCRKSAW
ncbi:MAG: hypothetical protein ACLQVF_36015 [Isosphaeraceae bacterium]